MEEADSWMTEPADRDLVAMREEMIGQDGIIFPVLSYDFEGGFFFNSEELDQIAYIESVSGTAAAREWGDAILDSRGNLSDRN